MRLPDKIRLLYLAIVNFFTYRFFRLLYKCRYKKKGSAKEIKRLLIIRLDKLGDLILTLPALKGLRKRYQQAKITALVHKDCAQVLESQNVVDEILRVALPWNKEGFKRTGAKEVFRLGRRLRKYHFDLAIDFRGDSRCVSIAYLAKAKEILSHTGGVFSSGRYGKIRDYKFLIDIEARIENPQGTHPIDLNLDVVKAIGIGQKRERVEFKTSKDDESYITRLFERYGIQPKRPKIVLHPGAGSPRRYWPTERYAKLALRLWQVYNPHILITGTKSERNLEEDILARVESASVTGLTGMLNLSQLATLLKKVDLLVISDTGVLHLAALCKTPVVGLYGPGSPIRWRPYDKRNHKLISKMGPCPVCPVQKSCDFRPITRCMDEIQVEDVWQTCQSLL